MGPNAPLHYCVPLQGHQPPVQHGGASSSSGAAPPTVIGQPIDNRAGMLVEMRNMMAEMSRQHEESTATGIRRGFEHVAEQMNMEQQRQQNGARH